MRSNARPGLSEHNHKSTQAMELRIMGPLNKVQLIGNAELSMLAGRDAGSSAGERVRQGDLARQVSVGRVFDTLDGGSPPPGCTP